MAKKEQPKKQSIPQDILEVLESAYLQETFMRLSYSHQKEYLDWIEEAKKTETREKRISKMKEMLSTKQN